MTLITLVNSQWEMSCVRQHATGEAPSSWQTLVTCVLVIAQSHKLETLSLTDAKTKIEASR